MGLGGWIWVGGFGWVWVGGFGWVIKWVWVGGRHIDCRRAGMRMQEAGVRETAPRRGAWGHT
mgnify:CR=1 FL=1